MEEKQENIEIDYKLISRLMKNWPKRASVRGCYFDEFKNTDDYDPSLPDYPTELAPFWNHPSFQKVDSEIQFKVLTWGWITYNIRTIHAEEKIVNPSFDIILQDKFEGLRDFSIKNVVHQSLIDERFHSLMHYNAMEITKDLRKVQDKIILPDSITYRVLKKDLDNEPERWKRIIMKLVAGIVSETSINAYLSLLSTNKEVQPKHALVSKLHDIDEFAHSSILVEIAKSVYINLNKKEKDFFVHYLPIAMNAFCLEDFLAWKSILKYYNIKKYDDIIGDCQSLKEKEKLVNDYSGLKRITEELDIRNKIDYNF